MQFFFRLLRVLRRGPRRQRLQAWIGLALVAAATVWVVFELWRLIIVIALFVGGFFLVGRALRQPPPSS
jgi:hypothetical protein